MNLPWLEPERLALNRALEAGRLGHAPMFLGSAGVGKRVLAGWLANRLLCTRPDDGEPCGTCHSCELISNATHPDRFVLEPLEDKTEILVDQVRDFIASLSLTPSVGEVRVGLMVPADRLNRNAANALLKTLEEPAGNVWLILVTDNEDRLPATITSRCQRRYVAVPDRASALEWLAERHGDRDQAQCGAALTLADGAPLLADAWLADAGLEQGLAIRDALAGVLRGRVDEGELVAMLQQSPASSWAWLARFSELWMKSLLAGPDEALAGAPLPPPDRRSLDALERCWRDALEGGRLAGRPVRHDWLFRAWLTGWRKLAGDSGTLRS